MPMKILFHNFFLRRIRTHYAHSSIMIMANEDDDNLKIIYKYFFNNLNFIVIIKCNFHNNNYHKK
jgi:hypothetical protein